MDNPKKITFEERATIFAKEILTISDLQRLFALNYDGAAKMMRELKSQSDHLKKVGRILVNDYFVAMGIQDFSRYKTVPVDDSRDPAAMTAAA